MIAGFCAVLLVKGVFAVVVPIDVRAVAAGARRRRWRSSSTLEGVGGRRGHAARRRAGGVGIRGRLRQRDRPLIPGRLPEQAAAGDAVTEGSLVGRSAYSAVWYAAGLVWYPLPFEPLGWIRRLARREGGAALAVAADAARGGGPAASSLRQGAWFGSRPRSCCWGLLARASEGRPLPLRGLLLRRRGRGHRRDQPLRLAAADLVERLDRPWVPAAFMSVWWSSACSAATCCRSSRSGEREPPTPCPARPGFAARAADAC